MDDDLFSFGDAAYWLGHSEKTVSGWIKGGDIAWNRDPKDKRRNVIHLDGLIHLASVKRIMLPPEFWSRANAGGAGGTHGAYPGAHPVEDLFRGGSFGAPTVAYVTNAGAGIGASIDRAVRRAIAFVDAGQPVLFLGMGDIIITSVAPIDLFSVASESLREEWLEALRRAYVRQQRRILHLIALDADLKRTVRVVKMMIPSLARIGALYHPARTKDAGGALSDLVIIPDRGILELRISRGGQLECEVHEHACGNDRYSEIMEQVKGWKKGAAALVTNYPVGDSYRFQQAIARLEAQPGHRCLVMNGLSDLSVPSAIHFARARALESRLSRATVTSAGASRLRQDVPMSIYRTRKERERAFDEIIAQYEVRDVCPIQAVRRYTHNGSYSPHDWFTSNGCGVLEPADRKGHLRHIVERLTTPRYDNYHLALIDRFDQIDPSIYRTFWLVKEGRGVLLEAVGHENTATAPAVAVELNLEINDEAIVEGFYSYSLELWERIHRSHKHRRWVITTLEKRIREIDALVARGGGS